MAKNMFDLDLQINQMGGITTDEIMTNTCESYKCPSAYCGGSGAIIANGNIVPDETTC